MVGEVNQYVIDTDRHGLIRVRFVIDKSIAPWKVIEYLLGKIQEKRPGVMVCKVNAHIFDQDVNKVQWSVRMCEFEKLGARVVKEKIFGYMETD